MHECWLIESHYISDNYESRPSGEYLDYQKNLEQKLNNTVTLPFIFNNKKNTYSNFTYNKDGSKLSLIIKNEDRTNFELIIFIPCKCAVKYNQKLNTIITKENYHNFLIHDERNILYKLFGNLSFLRLSQDTNNIYFLTERQILITSLDRTIFIFVKLDENNEYDEDNVMNTNDINNNDNNVTVKKLEDIIHEIKKKYIDINLKLSFINKNIDNLIHNSIPKNIFMDLPSYLFGKNFYLLTDRNKIILIFYIENNTDKKQYILIFFLNYKYTNNKEDPLSIEEDQKMTLEFCIGDAIKENNILSIMSKIKNGYLIICLSFNDEHFQIILIDLQLRLFKKYTSKIFFVPTKRNGNITVITDLFIYEKYVFIIFDFYYIIIFDLINFDIIPIIDRRDGEGDTNYAHNNNSNNAPNNLNIKKLFPKEYNKIIYLDFGKYNIKDKNNDEEIIDHGFLYLKTKKNIKEVLFSIVKSNHNNKSSKNIIDIIKMFNKRKNKDIKNIISNFNNNELYFYLNFLATLQKYSKNIIFYDKYLSQVLFILNDKILKNIYTNLQSKDGCITNLLLLNHNKYFGIYNSFLRYNISTIKYLYFIEDSDINEDINSINENINYLMIHKIIKNNENNKNLNLNDYYLSLSNNYLIIYQLISIIILLIKYDEKITYTLIQLYIKSNFNINNNNDYKFILHKIKQILMKLNKHKVLNPFNNDKRITFYNVKKKIIMEVRNNLMNINKKKNYTLFESVLVLICSNFYNEKNINEYSYKEIKFLKFIYFLISYYLNKIIDEKTLNNNSNIINTKIYNLYNINDILYSLDYLNISYEDIFNKFFIKDISLNIDNIRDIKELFYVLLTLKLINSKNEEKENIIKYLEENNNIEKSSIIIDIILFLLLLLNDKDFKNVNKEIKNNINKLTQELIEKKINNATHNKNFKLIFIYYYLIVNNVHFNDIQFTKKIIVMHLEKELSLFEFELIKTFKSLFKNKTNKKFYLAPINIIKYKNKREDIETNTLINLIKNKERLIFVNEKMTNKFSYFFSIISNVIDLLLFIFNEMPMQNGSYANNNTNNLIELLLQRDLNDKNNNYFNSYSYNNDNNNNYYNNENMSNLFKRFCVYFWLFNSLFTFIDEMNNVNLIASDLCKENVLISLLHIYYYYNKKFPDEYPILKKEIIQYIKFFIYCTNKKRIHSNNSTNILSIKMKNILETYMDKEILYENFKDIFLKKNESIINTSKNSNFLQNKKINQNEISEILHYLRINDIQFDMYLKDFKLLFLNKDNNLLKCTNNFIINLNNNMKSNSYLHKGKMIFNKYNKILKYIKFIELININISIDKHILLNDIHISKDSFKDYEPQILFSMRNSIQQLYKGFNNNNSINNLNNYIEIIPKIIYTNNNSVSDNDTTILNYNTLYSFSNNIMTTENKNDNTINNEDINVTIKENVDNNKYTSTMVQENKNKDNSKNDKLIKSVNMEELMKRIKNKKRFNSYDYQEDDLKCKYLSLKLLNKFFLNKTEGIKYMIFKKIKGLYYINKTNKIQNQINIIINEKGEI